MESSAIFLGIVPLLAFVIIDAFCGIKAAAVTTIIFAVLEVIITVFFFDSLDFVTVFTLITIIFFACFSYYLRNDIFIKLQPVILSVVFGVSLIISFLISRPILHEFAMKYSSFFTDERRFILMQPSTVALLKLSTLTLGFGLIFHGALTALAAFKMSNWWWIAIRGIGFYLFSFLSFYIARILI